MEIKKGDKFLCIKSKRMSGGEENGKYCYIKGKIYHSELDRCITDNFKDQKHIWYEKDKITEYFQPLKEEESNLEPKALRYNEGKLDLDLVPFEAVEEISKVLTFGAKKYSPDNWKKGLSIKKCMASLLRHAFAYMKGEKVDSETGLSHIAHIGCNVFFILWYEKFKPELYDIGEKEPK